MFNNILMVCIGNICRSPSAEYLLKHKLAHKPNITIHSAGLGALVDKPIDPSAGQLLSANGVDASEHRARQLTTDMSAEKPFCWGNGRKIKLFPTPTAKAWKPLSTSTVR